MSNKGIPDTKDGRTVSTIFEFSVKFLSHFQ
ncbi:MAG: hypothetical protein RLZZ262_540, partial [Bacteroidota bacterium]